MASPRVRIRPLVAALAVALVPAVAARVGGAPASLAVGDGERLLVVAPHPDDETLGCGGLVQVVLARGGEVRILTLTAGDGYVEAVRHEMAALSPRPDEYEDYGALRLGELANAVRVLGHGEARVDDLGLPDGGLRTLLREHWTRENPARSATTGAAAPPYDQVLDPEVRYDGADAVKAIRRVIDGLRPTLVAIPDPADAHPDHAASGLLALLALDARARAPAHDAGPTPKVLAYLVHWPAWPDAVAPGRPEAGYPELRRPPTLPDRGLPAVLLPLTPEQSRRKLLALEEHATQQRAMSGFLALFVRSSEPYTLFPPREVSQARTLTDEWLARTP